MPVIFKTFKIKERLKKCQRPQSVGNGVTNATWYTELENGVIGKTGRIQIKCGVSLTVKE